MADELAGGRTGPVGHRGANTTCCVPASAFRSGIWHR